MDTIKTKHWILLLGGIFLLSLTGMLLPRLWISPAPVAEIYQDGVLLRTISLTELTEPMTIPIKNGTQENVILAEKGQIKMESANCPDKLCVRQGAIQSGATPIVCLPHRLVIQIKNGEPTADAVTK